MGSISEVIQSDSKRILEDFDPARIYHPLDGKRSQQFKKEGNERTTYKNIDKIKKKRRG
jgi:uncharacterized protein (DUF2249 family)